MKKTALLPLTVAALALTTGCASTPTATERIFANVETNYVPKLVLQTNVVTLVQTNLVVQTVTLTNEVGQIVPVFVTNTTTQVSWQTNLVAVTNLVPIYTLTPNATATNTANVAGSVANILAPGTGGLVASGILGLLSIFLGVRNRQFAGKNDALSQSAGVLAQIIETGREVLSKTPQGQVAANAFTAWMVQHQAEVGVIGQITQIVKSSTNNTEAQAAANQILTLIGQAPSAPTAQPTKAA